MSRRRIATNPLYNTAIFWTKSRKFHILFTEVIFLENYIEENNPDYPEKIFASDDAEELENEKIRRKHEGGLEDIGAFQGILCLAAAVGLVILNITKPDMAEELFVMLKSFSGSDSGIISNPIDIIIEFIRNA